MNETLRYTQLGLAVAALLDKEEPLDAGQAQQYIQDGSLFSWLGRRYDGEIAERLRGRRPGGRPRAFQALSDTVGTGRTFGVESSGLALLAAYCFEVLQEIHYFKKPSRAPRPRRVPVPVPADQHTRAAGDHCHGHWPT